MVTKEAIHTFTSTKNIAIAGVSRDTKKFGNVLFLEMQKKGYNVIPVNPGAETINNIKCYKDISDLPDETESLLVVTRSLRTEGVVKKALQKGINNFWIQQKCETPEVIKLLEEAKVNYVAKYCILMFAEPVSGMHKLHRFLKGLFGGLPK